MPLLDPVPGRQARLRSTRWVSRCEGRSLSGDTKRALAHMSEVTRPMADAPSLRAMLIPLALAQFICSFAGSNMNVMINDISTDLHTTVQGVQVCITLFLLVMAALMIPCGKLTDRLGRKRCFRLGLTVYGVGAVLSALSPGTWRLDPRKLDLRGCRHRLADSASLHLDHHAVYGFEVAARGPSG